MPGVVRVEWTTTKASQGNPSTNHYCQQNLLVYSSTTGPDSVSRLIEFEATTNQHMKDPSVTQTLTVMFKCGVRVAICRFKP